MLFNSLSFLVFFPIVVLLYYVIPKKGRYLWLLVASFYFYMSWNPTYALLMAFSIIVTYFSGLGIDHCDKKCDASDDASLAKYAKQKKWIVAISFIINLAILVFFKYFDFLLRNMNSVLSLFHIATLRKPFDVLLPVGISFYTFQALSYTVDVYRKEMPAEKNILKYALFVSFFPQLVAGPIERSPNLLTQINDVPLGKPFEYKRVVNGLVMMLYGFFLKMVIADRISIVVNTVYDQYYVFGAIELIAATVAFAVQIYCDFASYSTIAIGAAEVMGFSLMENFNAPYFARSIQEFWRRWHISLSTWFKDYLYIPLGGNRCSPARKYFNIMVTFITSGLWHGASWSFLIWGFLHGAYQIIGSLLKPVKKWFIDKFKVNTECASYKGLQMFITFVLVCIAWVFFRANSISDALGIYERLFTRFNPWALFDSTLYTLGLNRFESNVLFISIGIMLLVDTIRYRKSQRFDTFLESQNLWFRWFAAVGLLVLVLIYGKYGSGFDAQQFIYFQF